MLKPFILSIFLVTICSVGSCTIHIVNNLGNTFIPDSIQINVGDTVRFAIGNTHDAREVSFNTFQSGGNSPLANGFQTAFGGGLLLPSQLSVGIHYYVCTPHASMGMKGVINVVSPTGGEVEHSKPDLIVFPNPAGVVTNILISGGLQGEVFVYDTDSELVYHGRVGESSQIPIGDWPTGVYFLRFDFGAVVDYRRLVVYH